MTKKFSTFMKVLIISIATIVFIPTIPSYAFITKNQAPNMYINWPDNGDYDLMMVDWYCEKDAENTYWAVHNWDKGYAGFQNKDGKHMLLLAVENKSKNEEAEIDYFTKDADASNPTYNNEGEGKHIFTNYNWKEGTWYTMCVGTRTINGKTQYAQWIREENGAWLLTAIISYPEANRKFDSDAVFQEDFCFNNYLRKCRLRNAYGRRCGTNNWESWNNGKVSDTYFPYQETTADDAEWNVNFDCDWYKSSDNSYIMLQSGGNTSSNGKNLPFKAKLHQSSTPAVGNPEWPNN